jgi:hypothetical protein
MNSIIVNSLEVLLFVLNEFILNDKVDEVFSLHQLFIIPWDPILVFFSVYHIRLSKSLNLVYLFSR